MNTEHGECIKQSWALIQKDGAGFSKFFYDTLFSKKPVLRKSFPEEMNRQENILLDMFMMLTLNLKNREKLAKVTLMLGRRHAHYGIISEDFKVFSDAFCETVATIDDRAQTQDAWRQLLSSLETYFVEGLNEIGPTPSLR